MRKNGKRKRTPRRDWEEWYADAKDYYLKHGDLLVPSQYVTDRGYRLGRWIERQRALHNNVASVQGHQTKTEEKLLEQIGMVWKLEYRFKWKEWMEAAAQYREKYGDLLVPKNYSMGNMNLGNWISEQRKRYEKKLLSEDEIAGLNELGMVWTVGFKRDWTEWYKDACEYYMREGDLVVPLHFETADGMKLGVWIAAQRDRYAGREGKSALTDEEIRLLEDIGMVWSLQDVRDQSWNEMYSFVRNFVDVHGRLPLSPKDEALPDGRRADYWIVTQRAALKDGKLDPERAALLHRLGILPQGGMQDEKKREWEKKFEYVSAWLEEHGRLPLSRDIVAPGNWKPQAWIAVQRRNLKAGKLLGERAERLARIGIFPYGSR